MVLPASLLGFGSFRNFYDAMALRRAVARVGNIPLRARRNIKRHGGGQHGTENGTGVQSPSLYLAI